MNKTMLKRYMDNKSNSKKELKTTSYTYKDKFLISDSYSIIKLNDNYGLSIQPDKFGLIGMFENFENNFTQICEYRQQDKTTDEKIDDKFSINHKIYNKIKEVIRANESNILANNDENSYLKYIIKLENTKTGEVAYMLPMKTY